MPAYKTDATNPSGCQPCARSKLTNNWQAKSCTASIDGNSAAKLKFIQADARHLANRLMMMKSVPRITLKRRTKNAQLTRLVTVVWLTG